MGRVVAERGREREKAKQAKKCGWNLCSALLRVYVCGVLLLPFIAPSLFLSPRRICSVFAERIKRLWSPAFTLSVWNT